MLYNVAQLLKEGIGATRHYELDAQLANLDADNPEPVQFTGQVKLLRTAAGVLAQVKARFTAMQSCRRCLEPVSGTFDLDFEEEYLPSIDVETGVKLAPNQDSDPALIIDEHHIIDLSEILRQYALVELAEGALCKADCKGLCPECGQNLNEATCSCERSQTDPRLAILAQLMQNADDTQRKEISR